jgi:hypothetical protein
MAEVQVCIFNPVTTLIDIVDSVDTYIGTAGAGAPLVLNPDGIIDPSLISGIGQGTFTATASTPLAAQSLVNLFYATIDSVTGVYAQPANASSLNPLPVMGYVATAAATGAPVAVFTTGLVAAPYLSSSGFSPTDTGNPVYLSAITPGGISSSASSPNLVQQVGTVYQVSNTIGGTVQFQFLLSNQGSVTSVAVAVPSRQSVSGSPVTDSGTITITDNTQSANLVFSSPASGSAAAPTFRSLVAADLPVSGVTAGNYTLTNLTVDECGRITAASNGTGSLTSVGLSAPAVFSVSGSPVTTSGTLAFTWLNQSANTLLSGPSSGSSTTPTFRTLVPADLPVATTSLLGAVKPDGTTIAVASGVISVAAGVATVTSVALSAPVEFSVSGSPITTSGTLTITKNNQNANLIYAGPSSGSAAPPTFRALASADLPIPHFVGEVPAGTAPTTTYTLTHTPLVVFGVFLNGQFLIPGSLSPPTYDYVISGTTITLNVSTETEDVIYAFYLY